MTLPPAAVPTGSANCWAALLPLLPREARVDVDLFARGGRAILAAVERAGYDVLTRRPEVGKAAKARLLAGAVARRWMG
jgi:phytoene/squalene synthetase